MISPAAASLSISYAAHCPTLPDLLTVDGSALLELFAIMILSILGFTGLISQHRASLQ
jgi:hypothetical protein